MARVRRAFTLVELLTVIAIIAITAAVLFPVFSSARVSGRKAACLANFRQVSQATFLYGSDYDDLFLPLNHQPAETPNSRNDRTWVQLLLPYVRTFRIFHCPGDDSARPRPEATFDQDLVPGDLYSQFYTASMRTNVGYNFQYLSPIYRIGGRWTARPKLMTQVESPSQTLMFIDSVWSVVNDRPSGGGSWLVSPPCRYERDEKNARIDTFVASTSVAGGGVRESLEVFAPVEGWDPGLATSANAYGGAWPWHGKRLNIARVDGSARSVLLDHLADGCDVKPKWRGDIVDRRRYAWYTP